jgi:hypothetical protein
MHERELEGRQRHAYAECVPGRCGAVNAIKPTGCSASTAMRYARPRRCKPSAAVSSEVSFDTGSLALHVIENVF